MTNLRRHSFRHLACWLSVLVTLVLGLLAAPGMAAPSTSGRIEAIKTRMEKGQSLFLAGKYREAAVVFEEGFEHFPYSAFLFNAGVSYEKAGVDDLALQRFQGYLDVDPQAPDAESVKRRIEGIERRSREQAAPREPGSPRTEEALEGAVMKSLVLVETEPLGAPVEVHARKDPGARTFRVGKENPGWQLVTRGRSPLSVTLAVGRYHVVVEAFEDFNVSEADIDVSPGHVHHFKANLSQGEFMGFLRVSTNVEGAYVYLDHGARGRAFWGRAPHGELVSPGPVGVWVEAPGYESKHRRIKLERGESRELKLELKRVSYGYLRVTANSSTAEVYVDGVSAGRWQRGSAPVELRVSAGTHLLRVEADGRKAFDGFVEVPAGQVQGVHAIMQQTYPRAAAWTQAVIGAAVLGGAAYLGVESNQLHEELRRDSRRGTTDAEDSRIARGRWFAIAADVGFVLGGSLALLSTYNFIRDPFPESRIEAAAAEEFDDPRREGSPAPEAAARKPGASRATVRVAPVAYGESLGLSIGGEF